MFFSQNDFANNLYLVEENILVNLNFTDITTNGKWVNVSNLHTDLLRLQHGKVGAQVSVSNYSDY